jgi:hypothetical protein
MDLTRHALVALANARNADPDYATRPVPARIIMFRGQLAAQLGAMLGIDPAFVTVTDDPDRARLGAYYAQRLSVSGITGAGPAYQFTPVVGYEAGPLFHLLGPCRSCGADSPVATISTLADLGYYFDTHLPPHQATDTHRCDPHHRPDCAEADH